MEINNNYQQFNFQSKFKSNAILEQAFDKASATGDRYFLQAVKAILNDGKNDTLELHRRNSRVLDLYVNNEIVEEGQIYLNYYGNVGSELIKQYVGKVTGKNMKGGKYSNLTTEELKLVQKKVDLVKKASERVEKLSNFIDVVQGKINSMKKIIDENTKNELNKLKEIVCN